MDSQPVKTSAPGFFRRMAAILYDSILLFGVWFIATAPLLALNEGKAVEPDQWFYTVYLVFVSFVFFGWFWTHGGQTLGMRAWKITIYTNGHGPVSWWHALARFAAAFISWGIAGLGFVWILFSRNKLGWHDYLSKTRIDWDERRSSTGSRTASK